MSDSTELRIGVVGAGGIAAAHLQSIGPKVGARAVAIADVNVAAARERAEKAGIPAVYEDYRDLIADPQVDAVLVCVPNFLHAPVSIAALKAGKHVLCEKPMATTVADARQMVEVAKANQRTLMLGQHYRYIAEVRKAKELIAQGVLGRIYFAKTGWIRRKGIPGWGSWFTQKERSGGGCLIDIGVHMLDVAWYLMGSPAPERVLGATFAEFGPKRRGLGGWGTRNDQGTFDVEDLASAIVRFRTGSALTVDVSWAAHHPDKIWLHLMGEKGGITLFDGPLTVYTEENGEQRQWQPEVQKDETREVLWRHFVHCCRTGARPISSGEEGLEVTRMLRAIYESAESGGSVSPEA